MKRETFTIALKELIEQHLEITISDPDEEINIDSFTMTLIITFVAEKIGVELDMELLDFDDFKSLNSLTALIFNQ